MKTYLFLHLLLYCGNKKIWSKDQIIESDISKEYLAVIEVHTKEQLAKYR